MLHYVVVAGTPAAVERAVPRLGRALDATRIVAGARVEHVGRDRTWAVAAETVDDPTCPQRIGLDGDAMVVFNGPALSAAGDQATLAADLVHGLRSAGSSGMADAIRGSFNLVGCSPEHGLHAFTDFSGMYALYWAQFAGLVVLSNRSSTVAAVTGRVGWDLATMSRQITYRNLFGDRVPVAGVAKLPAGRDLHVPWGASGAVMRRAPTWVWPDPGSHVEGDRMSDAEWDAVADDLVTGFRAASTFSGPLRMQLTGGKDSRLLLAVALGAGLRDRITTVTNGTEQNPEVHAAAEVARAAGVAHERIGPRPGLATAATDPSTFDAAGVWRRLRQHAFRYEGIVCPWDGMTAPLHGVGLTVKGFGGELYRQPPVVGLGSTTDLESMAEHFAAAPAPVDPLGVCRAEALDRDRRALVTWFRQSAAEVAVADLVEKHYVDYHLGHWTGPLAQCVPTRISLTPLLSSTVVRKVLRLPVRERQVERLHYEVMRRTAPELVAIPFLADTWHDEIATDATVPLPRDPMPTPVEATSRSLTAWQWTFFGTQGDEIERLFAAAEADTDMGAICDMGTLRSVARDASRIESPATGRSLLSAIGVATLLLGWAEPFVDIDREPG